MAGCFRGWLLLGCALALGACGGLPRTWEQTGGPIPAQPFRPALSECVARHDPARLEQLRTRGDYRISGWFGPDEEEALVLSCMRLKGWVLIPNALLDRPERDYWNPSRRRQ